MRLTATRHRHLPALSWFVEIDRDGAARLDCGADVELAEDRFFEGAWDGPFCAFGFASEANIFGSGARYAGGEWLFVPPSHTLEAIYLLNAGGVWFASNSLSFLAARCGASIAFRWPRTLRALVEPLNGLGAPALLPTSRGPIHIVHHHNVAVGDGLRLVPKPLPPAFSDYAEYRRYLERVLAAVRDNANDPARRAGYALLATVSTGYDSVACAALASAAGCREGLTITRSRTGDDDDGSAIGERLGLAMTGVPHPLATNSLYDDPLDAAAFFATGTLGEDIAYIAWKDRLRHRLLVTGFYGDKVWDKPGKASSTLVRTDLSGSSLAEYRLERGFIHLPLPFVGARSAPSVKAIANSPEMAPWSVGGDYDRPVPRRIAEEAGVPRELFGRDKRAVTTQMFISPAFWPQPMREAIEALRRRDGAARRIKYRLDLARYRLAAACHQISRRTSRYVPPALRPIYRRSWSAAQRIVVPERYKTLLYLHPFAGPATRWAIELAGTRYVPTTNRPRHERDAD